MTAQSAARAQTERRWKYKQFTLKSGSVAWQGGGAMLELATAKVVPCATPAATTTGYFFLGNFAESVDATSADKIVNIDLVEEVVTKRYVNATSTDAVGATDIGKIVYFLDDQTVTITRSNRVVAGRVWDIDSNGGIHVQKPHSSFTPGATLNLPAFAANDSAPADITNDAVYDVPTTAAASTVTLPAAALDGTTAKFVADGTKNGHTVTYRDATGTVALTTALVASKRHLVIATKSGGKWFANAYTSP